MLKGAYKNDLAIRQFFKKLIGNHFHFTVFGIDWLEERWLEGNTPTYQEFADMWVKETNQRKAFKSKPKEEWALINFIQQYTKNYPQISKEMVLEAWKQEHIKQVKLAHDLIKEIQIQLK